METKTHDNHPIVSLLSRSGSAVEAASLLALFVAACGCLVRAALHFL